MKFEGPPQPKIETPEKNNPEDSNLSRREFLKKAIAFGAIGMLPFATLADKHETNDSAESKIEAVERVINHTLPITGGRISLTQAEYEKIASSIEKTSARMTDVYHANFAESFNPQTQELIVQQLGEKLKIALLEAQKRGFEFKESDTAHLHFFVDSSEYKKEAAANNLPNEAALTDKLKSSIDGTEKMLKMVKSIVVHCAEFPTRDQIIDTAYWEKREYRNVVVNDEGLQNIFKPKESEAEHTATYAKLKGISETSCIPNQGILVEEYNTILGTNYEDLAHHMTGLDFLVNEGVGVQIDPLLPKLAFFLK